jgi:hypothetical protein
MPSNLLEPYRHQAYIPARRALDALAKLHADWLRNEPARLDAARIKATLPSLEIYVATLRRADGDHFAAYPLIVSIIAELRHIECRALDSIIGDLEHSRTEIDNA